MNIYLRVLGALSVVLLAGETTRAIPHRIPRPEHSVANIRGQEYSTAEVRQNLRQFEEDNNSDDDSDVDSVHSYSDEPNEPVYFKAIYPNRRMVRHFDFEDPDTLRRLPIHPTDDTRQQFLLRTQTRSHADEAQFQFELTNDLAKQRAFKSLLKDVDEPTGGAFWSTGRYAIISNRDKCPEQAIQAFWRGQLPVLIKNQHTGVLKFSHSEDEDYEETRRTLREHRPDVDYHLDERSDANTRFL